MNIIDKMMDRYKLINDDLLTISLFYSEYSGLANWNFLNKHLKDTGTVQRLLEVYDLKFIHEMFKGNTHKCSVCGKICLKKYETCSRKCQGKSVSVNEKRMKTNLERYNASNPFQSKNVKEKIKATNLERYGVENPFQADIIKEKIRKTNLERYGVEHPSQSKEFKQKFKDTCVARYRVESPMQSESIRQKVKDTCIERYGVENVMHNEEIKQKVRESNLLKYGVDSPFKLESVRQKIRESNILKYNVEYPSQSPVIKQKVKDTCIKKYGTDSYFKTDEFKERSRETNLERYGVENVMHNEEIKERARNTCIEKYGAKYPMQSDDVKNKVKDTCKKRYGVEYPIQSDEIRGRIKATCLEKYGVDNYFKTDEFKQKLHESNLLKYGPFSTDKDIPRTYMQRNLMNTKDLNFEGCQKFIQDGYFNIDEFAEYFNMSVSNAYKYKRYLGIETPCTDLCTSKAERELADFIESVLDEYCAKHKIPKVNVLKNDRSVINPLELDIYIPDLKLAVEYNGIYWHSLKDKYYHQSKSMLCYNKGIRLIHVYEEIDDIDIIKNLLKTVITSKLSNEHLSITNEHLCVTQESFKESFKIDLSKDDPFIPGYSVKEILEPIQISENLYNAGYFVLQKDI